MEEKTAKFSASCISRLLAGGKGATAQSYIYELALQSIGIKDNIDTSATRHGIVSQIQAFEKVILPLYPNAIWFDQYLSINDYCGASPDILFNSAPIEIKCPYTVDGFMEQTKNVPTKYYQQVQMQMMSCLSNVGYLCFYLTRPELWGQDDWQEYPVELEKRYKIFEFEADIALQEKILTKVDESEPKKQSMIQLLNSALVMHFEQFFDMQWNGYKLRKLKDCSNILGVSQAIRVGNEFYYEI
jgi:hypothetical protein